ncbi:MAG TPA: hypothetical protein VFS20_26680 [Longimicrobium sp.]|nr:hypothetical protein [Longimicrobium sp.]
MSVVYVPLRHPRVSMVSRYIPVGKVGTSALYTIRRTSPGCQGPTHRCHPRLIPFGSVTDCHTLSSGGLVAVAVRLYTKRRRGWAKPLLYSSTGVRARFMVRTVGSGCAMRRSPHSLTAPGSATLRHRCRRGCER